MRESIGLDVLNEVLIRPGRHEVAVVELNLRVDIVALLSFHFEPLILRSRQIQSHLGVQFVRLLLDDLQLANVSLGRRRREFIEQFDIDITISSLLSQLFHFLLLHLYLTDELAMSLLIAHNLRLVFMEVARRLLDEPVRTLRR